MSPLITYYCLTKPYLQLLVTGHPAALGHRLTGHLKGEDLAKKYSSTVFSHLSSPKIRTTLA